jgi:uncharacterized protein YaiI (UPF0178 family)
MRKIDRVFCWIATEPNGDEGDWKTMDGGDIGNALAGRDIARHLRELGQSIGGPAPLTKSDRSRFLSALDNAVQAALREAARS